MKKIYIANPQGDQTELSPEEAAEKLRVGEIDPESLAWMEGMESWEPINKLVGGAKAEHPPQPVAEQAKSPLSLSKRHPVSPNAQPSRILSTEEVGDRPVISSETSDSATVGTETPRRYSFTKNPRRVTTWLRGVIFAQIGIYALMLFNFLSLRGLVDSGYTESQWMEVAERVALLEKIELWLALSYLVLFLRWVHRANTNCHGFGGSPMRFSPGASVGYFFLPFFNLVRSYQILREIWLKSEAPEIPADAKRASPRVTAWWIFTFAGFFLTMIYTDLSERIVTVEQLTDFIHLGLFAYSWEVAGLCVTLGFVNAAMRMQHHLIRG